jgi:hypothetical protein
MPALKRPATGTYSVIVSNALSVLSSPSAVLTVLPANPPGTLVTVPHLFSGGTSSFNTPA